jgi:hypothetical protein
MSDAAYWLHSLVQLHHLNEPVNEWWGDGRDILDEAWSDEVEQEVFSAWRAKALRRHTWPAPSPEMRVLLVRPAVEFVYFAGLCAAMQARARAAKGPPLLWRFHAGRHCRRHDGLDGLQARPDDPVWRDALPPLAFFCDCGIEMRRAPASGAEPPSCRFFGGDKLDGPREFFRPGSTR